MNQDLVSIIIPAYNSERYIGETIQSILSQTYQNYEIIVVDDGSTDNTVEVVKSIDDKRVKYIYQKNASQAVARNTGISNSKGKFIAFLDNDDLWHPDKLEMQLRLFDNKETGLVYTKIEDIDRDGKSIKSRKSPNYYRGDVFIKLLEQNFIAVSSVMVRVELIKINNLYFRTGRQGSEDWDLWLRLARITKFDYVPKELVKYRVYPESMGNKKRELMYRSAIIVLDETKNELSIQEKRKYNSCYTKNYFFLTLWHGHWLISENRKSEARKTFLKAFKLNLFSFRPIWGIIKSFIK